jgi:hypothetical protein
MLILFSVVKRHAIHQRVRIINVITYYTYISKKTVADFNILKERFFFEVAYRYY